MGARLFLCGDVMTGRGIDQVLPHPCEPRLSRALGALGASTTSSWRSAHGPDRPRPSMPAYVWGDALDELRAQRPDARIVNLETAVTASDDALAGQGHPLPHAPGQRRAA